MSKPLMAKATAVWLVDNTTLSFKQIADFCGLHELEVQGIADGDVAGGVKGFDPVANNQLDPIEIERAEKDPRYALKLKYNPAAEGEEKAPRAALHAAIQTAGPPGFHFVAGQVPPGIGRCADSPPCRHHEFHDCRNPRAHALEHFQFATHRPGGAGLVQTVGTGCRSAQSR